MNILWSKISMFRSSLNILNLNQYDAQVMTMFYDAFLFRSLRLLYEFIQWAVRIFFKILLCFITKKVTWAWNKMSMDHMHLLCVFVFSLTTTGKYIVVFRSCVGCFNLLIWTYSVYILIYKIKYVKFIFILKYLLVMAASLQNAHVQTALFHHIFKKSYGVIGNPWIILNK